MVEFFEDEDYVAGFLVGDLVCFAFEYDSFSVTAGC